MSVSSNILLNKFKKKARAIQIAESISRTQALKRVAQDNGYSSWSDFKAEILSGAIHQDSTSKKYYSHEAGSNVNPQQIRGVRGTNLQFRDSFVSFVGEEFRRLNDFTSRAHFEIKSIISNSNDHVVICITFWIPTIMESRVADWDAYFDSLLNAYPQYLFVEYRFTDTPFRWFDQEIPGFSHRIMEEISRGIEK